MKTPSAQGACRVKYIRTMTWLIRTRHKFEKIPIIWEQFSDSDVRFCCKNVSVGNCVAHPSYIIWTIFLNVYYRAYIFTYDTLIAYRNMYSKKTYTLNYILKIKLRFNCIENYKSCLLQQKMYLSSTKCVRDMSSTQDRYTRRIIYEIYLFTVHFYLFILHFNVTVKKNQ